MGVFFSIRLMSMLGSVARKYSRRWWGHSPFIITRSKFCYTKGFSRLFTGRDIDVRIDMVTVDSQSSMGGDLPIILGNSGQGFARFIPPSPELNVSFDLDNNFRKMLLSIQLPIRILHILKPKNLIVNSNINPFLLNKSIHILKLLFRTKQNSSNNATIPQGIH